MKLSKVKKVCMAADEIVIKKADTGIDIQTWIGTRDALYPVRGININAAMAFRIWEIDQKKQHDMTILEDNDEGEAMTLITREELESMAVLGDAIEETENKMPGLWAVARINDYIVLTNRERNRAWILSMNKLGPIEGNIMLFIPIEEGRNEIAIYANGILEAVIYAVPLYYSDSMKEIIKTLATLYENDEDSASRKQLT